MRNRAPKSQKSASQILRQQIRSKYLQQYFGFKRASIQPKNLINIFTQFNQEINKTRNDPTDLILINKLINLYEANPYHPDTFTLIGNYLIDHPSAERYIIPRLLCADEKTKKIDQWCWVIILGIITVKEHSIQTLQNYDQAISDLISSADSCEQLRRYLDLLVILVNIENKQTERSYIPWQSFQKFEKKLPNIQIFQMKQDLKYLVVEVSCELLDSYFTQIQDNQSELYSPNIELYMNIIVLALSQFPNFRTIYLSILQTISLKYSSYIQHIICQTYNGKNVLRQLFYLLSQTKKFSRNILKILRYWVHMFSIQNLVIMLNQGLHIYLIQAVIEGSLNYSQNKGSIYGNNTNKVQDIDFQESVLSIGIKTVKAILDRLRQKQEEKLLNQILVDIESRGFQKWANQFYETRHERSEEIALTELVDQYYSDELDE